MKTAKKIWWAFKLFFARFYYGNPAKKLKIIGVTGTNGKTTTVTLLHQISTALGHKAGLISTVQVLAGEEKLKTDSGRPIPATTPDSVTLVKMFFQMAKAGCEYVFMEVSSHALDQNRVVGIKFAGGIFTNLTHDHLDYHKNIESYFHAKKKFFEMLPKNAFALSNLDDEHGFLMLDGTLAQKLTYGFNPDLLLDFKGRILDSSFSGLELDFNDQKIFSKLLGKFNAYNLLAVWSASKLLGFDIGKVNKILEDIRPPKGRFEHLTSKNGVSAIIDYAHSPDALLKVLSAIGEIKNENSKIISVFGCGGDRDRTKRPKMGKIGASLSDIAIFTSDNPRNEDPEKIIDQMQDELDEEESDKVITIPDRRKAIGQAIELARPGDIILCAGKGHEDYQEIKGVKNHFDDREEFQKLFQK